MDPEEWRRIHQVIYVDAPMESVYAAWATSEGLAGWFPMEAVLTDAGGAELPPGTAAVEGGGFKFIWHTGHTEKGEFLEANGSDRLRFTFGEAIVVAVTLEEAGDGTVAVVLKQTQDRSDEDNLKVLLGFKEGWAFYLTNLKSVLEGGMDLRDLAHDIEHRVNY